MRKMLLASLALLFSANIASAQDFNEPILFENETVKVNEPRNDEAVKHGNYHYVVVQHPKLVLQKDFYGFETMNYLPKYAAFARVSNAKFLQSKRQLESAGGHVLEIADAWRLSPNMFTNNYPEWAWAEDGQSMIMWISYWDGLAHFEIVQALQSAEIFIRQEVPSDQRVEIVFDPENIDQLLDLGFIKYIEEKYAPGEPENFTARTNVRTNWLQQGAFKGGLPINYDGTGIMVAHNDAGAITPHIDFKGRFSQNASGAGSDHGDHTAGTISGAGNRDPYGQGMAPGADMFYALYPGNLNAADNIYTSINARLTSNSFSNGCNQGYTTWSEQLDLDAQQNPLMLHVFSAGNNGSSSCAVNYGAGIGWGNITGGHKQAKNVVTVGNVTRLDALAPSSSRGPASDGRIKPDIVAVGTQVYSTTDANGPNTYNTKTGTSMSCPGVTGTLAVLMQAYKDLNNGAEAEGVLLKGILQNTADDLGNVGPDFRYGYGRVNAKRAYEVIEDASYVLDSVGTGDSVSISMTIPANTAQARFFVIWADPSAQPTASLDLVNDLDMTVDYNGTDYQPWVLDPTPNAASLNSVAVRSRDSLNNMEQVTLDNPTAGAVSIKVKGFNVPQGGDQRFYLIAFYEEDKLEITYPTAGQALAVGNTELIRFDAPHASTHSADYSDDGGATWTNFTNTFNNTTRSMAWNVPGFSSDQIYIRVRNNQDTAMVGPITIVGVPSGLTVVAACPDSVQLDWGNISGASGYVVYHLGAKYMDSVTYVTTSNATIAHNPLVNDWYAVAAVVNDTSVGFRSEAIEKQPGVFNCVIPNDLELVAVVSPGNGDIPECAAGADSDRPAILIRNNGTTSFSSFDVGFVRTGISPVTETVNRSINPGDTIVYYFSNRITLLSNVYLTYQFWIAPSDGNAFNDTLNIAASKAFTSNQLFTAPYTQDFESFSLCATTTNCGVTSCSMRDGWHNSVNNLGDEIDWRTNSGTTASSGTGPNFDFSPGNSTGKYLYLESSNSCDSALAALLSPCFDLSGTFRPHATIMYHMSGSDMGTLSADVYDGERWHINVVPTVSGDQGTAWTPLTIDLTPFAGKIISIRYRGKTGQGFRSDLALDGFNLVDSSSVGLEEEKLAQSLKVYPNPSNGLFTLESDLPLGSDAQIEIRDLRGQLVWSGQFEANLGARAMQIDLGEFANGVYLLELVSDEQKASLKLIKE